MKPGRHLVILLTLLVFSLSAAAEGTDTSAIPNERYDADCLPLKIPGKHGPFDYRTATQSARALVERFHFSDHYMGYRLGKSTIKKSADGIIETPAAGFSYTLWAFPNHPQALAAMEDISHREKTDKPRGAQLRIHCYFQRAVRFTPNDPIVRALYGYYYARRKMRQEAVAELTLAEELSANDSNVHSYVAWSYLELGDLEEAATNARRAYALGYPLPGLSDRLKRAGKPID